MNKLSQKIIKEIEKDRIKPISKVNFYLKNVAVWFVALFSIFIGTFSIAIISYNVSARDWDLYEYLGDSFFGYLISSLPYLWIGLTIVSLIIGIINLEHTKKGYKYSPLLITLFSLVITFILGLTIHTTGGGKMIDEYIGQKINHYQTVEDNKEKLWNQPSKGLFSGTIINISTNTFDLEDLSGTVWQVDYSHASIRGNIQIKNNVKIKIIGTVKNTVIEASDIRPWGTSNGRGNHHSQ